MKWRTFSSTWWETYINGNHSTFTRLFKELEKDARRLFIEYLLWESQSPIPRGNTESNHLKNYGMDKIISQMTKEEKLQALADYHACKRERHIILRYIQALRREDAEQTAYFESFGESVHQLC